MTGLQKYNQPAKVQRLGNDSVYGGGNDGNVVIASNTTLSRDMYYNNLTIDSGFQLNPNGYKIFVKGTLALNGNIALGANNSTGTVSGASQVAAGNLSYSVGGNSASNTYTATQLTDGQKNNILDIINGVITDSNGTVNAITGGAGGAVGTVTPAGSGGAGSLNRNALVAGGPGSAGTTPPAASGGVGGGVILLVAKTITGSGAIITTGVNAGAAATGSTGSAAPNATLSHSTDGSAHYITGDGSTGPHTTVSAPPVPHGGHLGATTQDIHGHNHRHVVVGNTHHNQGGAHYDHQQKTGGQSNFGHGWNPVHSAENTTNFTNLNGITHTTAHRPDYGSIAFTSYYTHTSGHFGGTNDTDYHHTYFPASHDSKHGHIPAYHYIYGYPRHHADTYYTHVASRRAGTVSSAGSVTYPGGSGGTAGSTTAGKSGGGGGIIIVTDSIANTVSTSTTGGTAGGISGGSGLAITILNT